MSTDTNEFWDNNPIETTSNEDNKEIIKDSQLQIQKNIHMENEERYSTYPVKSFYIFEDWIKKENNNNNNNSTKSNVNNSSIATRYEAMRAADEVSDFINQLSTIFAGMHYVPFKNVVIASNGAKYTAVNFSGSFIEGLRFILELRAIPASLNGELEKKYRLLMDCYWALKEYINFRSSSTARFNREKFIKNYADKRPLPESLYKLAGISANSNKILVNKHFTSFEKSSQSTPPFLESSLLLNYDYYRASIKPYESSRLTDSRQGHWELVEKGDSHDGMKEVCPPEGTTYYARPPQADVKWGAVCGIDFGTKSTVVVCRDEHNVERMIRAGKGNYQEELTIEDCENPTVIELVDKDSFMTAYKKRKGRPFTSWNDLTVSHQAAGAIKNNESNSEIFDSVFANLKQWTHEEDRDYWLYDQKTKAPFRLRPHKEIREGDFDPIEIYAYYLGLYINNMTTGVYLKYIMSYPATYSEEIRQRICNSFRRGLWKSLPPALQNDSKIEEEFSVEPGAGEPTAYAACALKEYGLQPKKGSTDKIAYGVFDFGGGTTDFDFGLMSRDKKYFYKIEQLGTGGDPHLGGENLLELLAYKIYKKNFAIFRDAGIQFVLPPDEESFAGAESYVLLPESASRQAYLNNRYLAEAVRPLWEEPTKSNFSVKVSLYHEKDNSTYTLTPFSGEISIDNDELQNYLSNRIEEGVERFFAEMETAFEDTNSHLIHILLAGNSCRSPLVKQLFDKHIKEFQEEHQDMELKLWLPLGQENKDDGEDDKLNLDKKRTGKTGVAFGLLRTRKGGKDIRIVERKEKDLEGKVVLPFPYYLGCSDEDDCFEVVIDKDVPYGQWKWFTYADVNEFELYYTDNARATDGDTKVTEVQTLHCRFNDSEVSDDDDVGVYIRKKSPEEIQYAIGREDDANKDKFMNIYSKKM